MKNLLHPKYWPMWLAFGILWLIAQLPYRAALAVGRGLGKLMYWVIPKRRHIVRTNLAKCFPERSAEEREALLRKHYAAVGMAITETAMSWFMPLWRLNRLQADAEGREHIDKAMAAGKGLLILGGHFTTIDIIGSLVGIHSEYKVCVVFREQNNALVDWMLRRHRRRTSIEIIHRHDIRGMVRALQNNKILWYAPDQDYGTKHSVFAPFFGIATNTITAPLRLAKMSGAPVATISHHRLANNVGYHAVISPILTNFPSDDPVADMTRVNHAIETAVRKYPEQYLWLHRRFKHRPAGEPSFY